MNTLSQAFVSALAIIQRAFPDAEVVVKAVHPEGKISGSGGITVAEGGTKPRERVIEVRRKCGVGYTRLPME